MNPRVVPVSTSSVMVSLMHGTVAGILMGLPWLTLLAACVACILPTELINLKRSWKGGHRRDWKEKREGEREFNYILIKIIL